MEELKYHYTFLVPRGSSFREVADINQYSTMCLHNFIVNELPSNLKEEIIDLSSILSNQMLRKFNANLSEDYSGRRDKTMVNRVKSMILLISKVSNVYFKELGIESSEELRIAGRLLYKITSTKTSKKDKAESYQLLDSMTKRELKLYLECLSLFKYTRSDAFDDINNKSYFNETTLNSFDNREFNMLMRDLDVQIKVFSHYLYLIKNFDIDLFEYNLDDFNGVYDDFLNAYSYNAYGIYTYSNSFSYNAKHSYIKVKDFSDKEVYKASSWKNKTEEQSISEKVVIRENEEYHPVNINFNSIVGGYPRNLFYGKQYKTDLDIISGLSSSVDFKLVFEDKLNDAVYKKIVSREGPHIENKIQMLNPTKELVYTKISGIWKPLLYMPSIYSFDYSINMISLSLEDGCIYVPSFAIHDLMSKTIRPLSHIINENLTNNIGLSFYSENMIDGNLKSIGEFNSFDNLDIGTLYRALIFKVKYDMNFTERFERRLRLLVHVYNQLKMENTISLQSGVKVIPKLNKEQKNEVFKLIKKYEFPFHSDFNSIDKYVKNIEELTNEEGTYGKFSRLQNIKSKRYKQKGMIDSGGMENCYIDHMSYLSYHLTPLIHEETMQRRTNGY